MEFQTKNYGIFDIEIADCSVDRALYDGAFWDVHLKPYFDALSPTDNAIDIGAYCGFHTVYLAKRINHVYSVEPQPGVFTRLENAIRLNNLSNVTLINKAAFDCERKMRVLINQKIIGPGDKEWACHSIAPDERIEEISRNPDKDGQAWLKFLEGTEVHGSRLDSIIPLDVSIALIKCDAQGSDLKALQGCRKIIEKWKPIVLFEYEGVSNFLYEHKIEHYFDYFLNDLKYESVEHIKCDLMIDYIARPYAV